ncbi:hypothetical protein [Clostridium cellulovorans]|uniref:Uncharacterized protein n=1 Tax=Clostridium cellulovorans (strain ATCC 35296 / DSM 3052 / OCM 3 / 743B) TaxID=573061 RepID=D9SRQ8_CLOC7|nr:hypothetical protein [Clostridium cellulovorans]ADL50425.1 hypothetical protein Clocel_0654 [Clostridium cellulovorans 743B]
MELRIEKVRLKDNYQYKIIEEDNLINTAEVNRIVYFDFRKISLFDTDGNEVISLRQEDKKKLILENTPIISIFRFSSCPYIYYKNGENQGYLRNNHGSVIGEILGKKFEIWSHSHKDISVYCDDVQVAAIKIKRLKKVYCDEYKVIYDKDFDKELAIMTCLFSDVVWNIPSNEFDGPRDQWEKQIFGKKINSNWKPKE